MTFPTTHLHTSSPINALTKSYQSQHYRSFSKVNKKAWRCQISLMLQPFSKPSTHIQNTNLLLLLLSFRMRVFRSSCPLARLMNICWNWAFCAWRSLMTWSEDISAEINSEEDEKPVVVPVMMCMIMGCACNDFKDFGRFKFANQNNQNFISLNLKGSTCL